MQASTFWRALLVVVRVVARLVVLVELRGLLTLRRAVVLAFVVRVRAVVLRAVVRGLRADVVARFRVVVERVARFFVAAVRRRVVDAFIP